MAEGKIKEALLVFCFSFLTFLPRLDKGQSFLTFKIGESNIWKHETDKIGNKFCCHKMQLNIHLHFTQSDEIYIEIIEIRPFSQSLSNNKHIIKIAWENRLSIWTLYQDSWLFQCFQFKWNKQQELKSISRNIITSIKRSFGRFLRCSIRSWKGKKPKVSNN